MGQRLSLLAPSAPTVAVSSYIDALNNYQYVEILNNSRFLKTIKAIDKTTGNLVIIKLLIKPASTNYTIQLQQVIELLVKQSSLVYPFKNTLPWHKVIETDRAGYLIVNSPFLEPVEKLFITFQILKIVNEIHSLNIQHGDLRLENFLVTSWNWILLTDFASLIKPTYIPEDNPNQYSFYFDSSGRRLCYIAPERFYNSQDHPKHVLNFNDDGLFSLKNSVTDSMDLFSMGCVIAELYNDGEPTFTLSQLFKFMKNDYKPDLSGIQNPHIVQLIEKLIKLDSNERSSARELLDEYRGSCFPEFFYTFLYDFMETLNSQENFISSEGDDNLSVSDLKINYIYDNFDVISKQLSFDYQTDTPISDEILPMRLNLPTMPQDYRIKPRRLDNGEVEEEAALIILNAVTSLSQTLKQVNSKIKCCELILALSEHISDENKLDRSLPYLCLFLDEYIEASLYQDGVNISPKVVVVALYALTSLIMSCSYIRPINVLLFPEYILPKVYNLLLLKGSLQSQRLVNSAVAVCLPSLATTAKKFWGMSKAFKNENAVTNTLISPEDVMQSYSTLKLTKDQLDAKFKDITVLLLTDSESSVKIKLRLAFLSSVLRMGPFIGVLSFEQYILPLLVQSIGDGEQFVVLQVLEIFNTFVKNRLINPRKEFNALEIYKELLLNSINLLLHPNQWIRDAIINLIISISNNLTDADRYCFLYPMIKSFLTYDLSIIDWNTLYPCLTKPLSKTVYDLTITWSLNSTPKSLFWQQKALSMNNTNGILNNKKKLISFSKNMGKSVYLPRSEMTFSNGTNKGSSVPLSSEDKQWLLKLKSIGLDDKSLWKVFLLRDYIYHVSRSNVANSQLKSFDDVAILPRNIFFDIVYKSEFMTDPNGVKEETYEPNIEDTVSVRNSSRRGSNSLILPQLERVTAVFSVNNSKIITSHIKHTYTGHNPYILSFLKDSKIQPTLADFEEFGKLIIHKSQPQQQQQQETTDQFVPKGVLVASFKCTDQTNSIDDINTLVVCPTSEFFVTGSSNGSLKVWDSLKMEKIVTVKNANLSVELDSGICSVTFLPNRFVIVVTTADGMVRLLRIDVIRNNKNKRIARYSKMQLIRQYHNELPINNVKFLQDNYIIGTDAEQKIVVFDIITMEKLYELQNPLIYGIVNTFVVHKDSWILAGSDKGFLTLWDLRFKIIVRTWRVQNDVTNDYIKSISALEALPRSIKLVNTHDDSVYFAMVCNSDISVWELPSMECKAILRSQLGENLKYSLVENKNESDFNIEEIIDDIRIDIDSKVELNISWMKYFRYEGNTDYLICSTSDNKVVLYNLTSIQDSVTLGVEKSKFVKRFFSNLVIIDEVNDAPTGTDTTYNIIKYVDVLYEPSHMIITVDKNNCISIYK
ncbi:putative serine/threonine-protein kinase VPS15 [Candida viswanathii]|uniref:non-specific serine/threonine protein kinase n=1 Tax=Candida viswanathii TaxID=5486 RepID=A0A367XUJ3_9ASCO|nr:putative serine/threonine-protein kinase VPS15 [Candida viswanathii]